ncbi:hypothetical protein EYC84_006071 [Monilinia fructicola]|uniref:Uncharacterized protein n=1 Tax=Monilinia fructicola TaxID=38448 RepID=A0A5M9K6R7_MONFR|nr:hypothetical protein EYC84_006071 [Monilinia fructicola]
MLQIVNKICATDECKIASQSEHYPNTKESSWSIRMIYDVDVPIIKKLMQSKVMGQGGKVWVGFLTDYERLPQSFSEAPQLAFGIKDESELGA